MDRLVAFAVRRRFLMLALFLGMVVGGLVAFARLNIEAYPDPIQPRIEVITQPFGWSAEEVERYVTIPLETGLNGMQDLEDCRSISIFELSDIKCYFSWDSNYRWDRQEVLSRLQLVNLPNNLQSNLSPDNPIGEVFRYTVEAPGYDLTDAKAADPSVMKVRPVAVCHYRKAAGPVWWSADGWRGF